MSEEQSKPILLGRVTGLYGVKGWIKVHSHTHPRENIVNFVRWTLRRGDEHAPMDVEHGRLQGRTVVAKLQGIDDRDQARRLIGAEIAVERGDLPPCEPAVHGADLEGWLFAPRPGMISGASTTCSQRGRMTSWGCGGTAATDSLREAENRSQNRFWIAP